MSFLVLGVILCGLYFWGQFHKNIKIVWPLAAITFLIAGILCVIFRPYMTDFDLPSIIGAWFVLGTAFYALRQRFFSKPKKTKKRL